MSRQPFKIIIVDDDEDIRLALVMLLNSQGYQTLEADGPQQLEAMLGRITPDLILLDMNFHRDTTSGEEGIAILEQLTAQQHKVVLITAWGSIELAVKGMQLGALDFIEKPWNKKRLLDIIAKCQSTTTASAANTLVAEKGWITASPPMQQLESMLQQIAPTDANILILGENGTGKSELAKRIHSLSQRSNAPFVSVNMATVPENLFESELFGHKAGAYTDAKESRKGRFELAETGTLFLDEIGTMPLSVQPKLLRVLENKEFEALGSSNTHKADVRLVTATNSALDDLVAKGEFRRDLLFRLNTFTIELPPLRKRLEDIAPLAEMFAAHFATKYQRPCPKLREDALQQLKGYPWPGNIRELSHVMERAVLLSQDQQIRPQQLMLENTAAQAPQNEQIKHLDAIELEMIQLALQQHQGHISNAANALGISRNALYRRMEKFGIPKGNDERGNRG